MSNPTHAELLAELQRLARERIARRKRIHLEEFRQASYVELKALDRLAEMKDIEL